MNLMKKLISLLCMVLISVICLAPFTAFANEVNTDDTYFNWERFEALEHSYSLGVTPYATGLIVDTKLGIAKDKSTLVIIGYTKGNNKVIKSGFTKVIVQRKKSNSKSWSNYKKYTDLYSNSSQYNLNKSIHVENGYQYRVTATHYAKKSLFSTQKINATTGYLTF